jgi:hypothetical protein
VLKEPLRPAREAAAFRRQEATADAAFEQFDAEISFERPHCARDRRLRDMEMACRRAHGSDLCHGIEGTQLTDAWQHLLGHGRHNRT